MPVVIHSVNPYLEPTTGWIYDQIRSLTRYDPIVFGRYVRNLDRFPTDHLIDFTDTGRLTLLGDRLVTRFRGTYPRYGRAVREHGGKVIHAHFGQEGYRCLAAKEEAGVPLVTTFYGLDMSALPKIPKWSRRYQRLFAEGDRFLCEGPHMASELVEIGCPEDKVRVQRLGIDLSEFEYRAPQDRGEPRSILVYASLREKKGHRFAIDAFARIAKAHLDVTLTLAGGGPLDTELRGQVAGLGLQDRVSSLGAVTREEGKALLASAGLLLSPSITASDGDSEGGAPVVLLEAMAMGTPVVASRHADIPYVLLEGEGGSLVGEGDVDGLAGAIDELLTSDSERQRLAEAGRACVEERHGLAVQANSLQSVYDEACSLA